MADEAPNGPSKGHYEFDLDCQVETCIDEYEQEMMAWYAEGGPTDAELSMAIFEQAARYAEHVLGTPEELVPPKPTDCASVAPELKHLIGQFESRLASLASVLQQKGLSPRPFLTALRDIASEVRPEDGTILKVVWELLLIRAMWDAVGRSRGAASRLLMLSTVNIPATPTARTRAFLKQASQCFVLGLHVPCIVFCRSVIDVALKDAGITKGSLKDRIDKAPADLLCKEGKRCAHEIRELGNDAVHDKPLAMSDVLEVVRKTLTVVQQITSSAGL